MIYNELHTGFRWYNDILKQNRYKSYCGKECDFKLLSPCNKLLPFIIPTQTVPTSWKIYNSSDVLIIDISSCLSEVVERIGDLGDRYLEYKGADLSCVFSLECGYYYSVLSDGSSGLYSELFYVVPIQEPPLIQIDFPLNVCWPWYDDQRKQNRYKAQCLSTCEYYTITGKNVLPPFQFRRPHSTTPISSWILKNLDGTCEIILDTSLLVVTTVGDWDYIEYDHVPITNLECGIFESIINGIYYSELVQIIDDETMADTNFILQETGDFLLQEDADKLKLE